MIFRSISQVLPAMLWFQRSSARRSGFPIKINPVTSIASIALSLTLLVCKAQAVDQVKPLPQDARVCPSWAEAHERTRAGLNNNGRKSPGQRWLGWVWFVKGTPVVIVANDMDWTEIVYQGKHWFADEQLFE
jgi:hypothetical protein